MLLFGVFFRIVFHIVSYFMTEITDICPCISKIHRYQSNDTFNAEVKVLQLVYFALHELLRN